MGKDYLSMVSPSPDDLEQTGVKGMKWGVRKSDNHVARLQRVADGTASRRDKVRIGKSSRTRDMVKSGGDLQKVAQARLDRISARGDKKAAPTAVKKTEGPEHPADRYTRLLAQAKQKGGNSLNEEELRFVTQRGDAIARVNRLNERKPGWAAEAAKQVLLQVAKKQMKGVADSLTDKYIGAPLSAQKSA